MDASDSEAVGGEVARTFLDWMQGYYDYDYPRTCTFHHWTRLPDELKVEMLAHHLDQDAHYLHQDNMHPIRGFTHRYIFESHLGPIIGTRNRELTTIALETYYTRNVFLVETGYPAVCYYPPAAYGCMIRHLRVQVRCICDPHDFDDEWRVQTWLAWQHLLLPEKPVEAGKYPSFSPLASAWQANFPNLQTLEIAVYISDPYKEPGPTNCSKREVRPLVLQKIIELVAGMSITLKARKVYGIASCGCEREVVSMLEEMAKKPKE